MGLPAPPTQGNLVVISALPSPYAAIAKLSGCETSEPIEGEKLWQLSDKKTSENLLSERRNNRDTMRIWSTPNSTIIDRGERKEILEIADQMETKLAEKKEAKPSARSERADVDGGASKRRRDHAAMREGLRREPHARNRVYRHRLY